MAKFAATYGHGPTRVQFQNKDPRGFAEYIRQLAEHSVAGSANTMLGYQGRRPSLYDLTEEMARIDVPTLIMAGDEEEPCLEVNLLMKRAIPTAGLAILPKSGHGINLEEPALFNPLAGGFLPPGRGRTLGPARPARGRRIHLRAERNPVRYPLNCLGREPLQVKETPSPSPRGVNSAMRAPDRMQTLTKVMSLRAWRHS